ncbi:MAG: hypothetical protein DRP93_06580, partial [Candidatus Neomarinimicrobiota bacterium]
HTIEFRAADGTTVDLASGNSVTIKLTYTSDTTVAADFQVKTTQVIIAGTDTYTYDFSNLVADDFLNEVSESYTLSIDSVADTNSYFEDLKITGDTVTGTINDEATPDTALVSIHGAQTITEGDISTNYVLQVDQPQSDVSSDIIVNLTYSGTAQDGIDFSGISQVIISAGTNLTRFNIATINDTLVEGSEDFTITIGTITDSNFEAIDVDSSASSVVSTIIDDVSAKPETADVIEGGNTISTPNLLDNDEVGDNAQVTSFTYTDEAGVTQTGTVGVLTDTQYGEITVNADGSWSYTSDPYEAHSDDSNTDSATLPEVISYTITDANNDSDTSTLTINVQDAIATITPQAVQSVDEDDLAHGSDNTKESLIINDIDLGINLNKDPIENVFFDLTKVQTALSSLRSDGQALSYGLANSGHTLVALDHNGSSIFSVDINSNAGSFDEGSTYTFRLNSILDHPSAGEDSLNLAIPFSIKELGADEDIVDGIISVDVIDDIPTAVVDSEATVEEGGALISGNVLTNDTQGADTAELYQFSYKDITGVTQTSTSFGILVTTATGDLTLNQDGSWIFTPNTYVDHNDAIQGDGTASDGSENDSTQGSFNYKLIDGDGDISNEIKQTIHVTDGADPISSSVVNAVDEDDLTNGSDTNKEAVLVSGNLSVTGGSDPVDVTFTTSSSDTLTSNGVAISYTLSNNGHTLTGKAGSIEIFVADISNATANNPAYTFELKGQLDHQNAAGENTQDITIEYQTLDIDGDRVTSNLVVSVTDDIAYTGTNQEDGYVDESGLAFGSATDYKKVIDSGSLDVLSEADDFDTIFTQATINTLTALSGINGNGIESNTEVLTYTISNSGHTLVGSTSHGDVFQVDIVNFDSSSASYDFELKGAIDHITAGSDETLPFNFSVIDYDGDTASNSFDVVIHDDIGASDKTISVDEDGSVIFGVTADDIQSFEGDNARYGTVSFDDAKNRFTYTPDANYSGQDNDGINGFFTINYTTAGGAKTVNITATVNPISDAPTLGNSGDTSTDEDISVALGFLAPVVTDATDQNTGESGDNPERLSAIKLSGLTNGTKLVDVNGAVLFTSTGSSVKIV